MIKTDNFVGNYRWQALLILWLATLMLTSAAPAKAAQEVVYRIDFTHQPAGDAIPWLTEHGFELRLDAKKLNPHFQDQRLILETQEERAGLFIRELNLTDVETIRISWGVDRYPEGADWDNDVFRVPIAVVISFGEEKISSGSFFVPNAPYFISLFLSENAREGQPYTANYYQEGGRYFCVPCGSPTGETVTTAFNVIEAFKQQFGASTIPPITSFGFQMNTKDTEGGARAFLKKVEFLAR